MRVVQLLKISV